MDHILDYNWARALHIISVIAWVAGMLMLPRFYAYITGATPGGELETTMLKAADRLRKIIVAPSMIAAWVFGIYLFGTYVVSDWERPIGEVLASVPHWFWGKLLLVVGLSGFHGFLVGQGKKLAKGERRYSEKAWRLMSEIPFLVAIGAVLLAVLEPGR